MTHPVRTGLEVLLRDRLGLLAGRRIGLVSHPAAVLPDLTPGVDALLAAGAYIVALFAMEHGFGGAAAAGATVENVRDRHTGLPVYSLYGAVREPTGEMLADVEALVYDVQDVGARFYTYISTLYHLLGAGQGQQCPLVVLDRPAPLTGLSLEGPLVEPECRSFVGIVPVPIRYGLTPGELARYMNAEFQLGADLTVVPMEGWAREQWFDESGLPWVTTSPAIPHLSSATAYPGMCLIEGTNISEGRGTALPFELAGAPWLDGHALAAALNALDLPGVRFRPAAFQPWASKHAGLDCEGVQLHITDRRAFRPVATGLHLVAACRGQAPDKFEFLPNRAAGQPGPFDRLAGTTAVRRSLAAGLPAGDIATGWAADEERFNRQRQPYLLY